MNLVPSASSQIPRHTKYWRGCGLDRATHVILDLRCVDIPNYFERGNRVMVDPIDAQIHDRPRDIAHDEQAGRVNRPRLSTPLDTCPQRLEQPCAKMPGGSLECLDHDRRYRGLTQ